ncbi:hypothetical protein LCGC14_0346610 [marine sediment metagenome]|uniref:Uncharacterized protein n=1 Tax=marine sediment metagenome TaxID=412755 RepID=A0A0F9WJT2_9ZZZZ
MTEFIEDDINFYKYQLKKLTEKEENKNDNTSV